MGKLKEAEPESDLGVAVKGQAGAQTVTIDRDDSIMRIFNTKHPEQAKAMLANCWNALARNEGDDDQPGNDQ